jgi:hypothetical protein
LFLYDILNQITSIKVGYQMFVKAVPDNKKDRNGYYCSLVESRRVDGKSRHVLMQSLGYVPSERLPFLRAAFNEGNPEEILSREKKKLAARKTGGNENGKA